MELEQWNRSAASFWCKFLKMSEGEDRFFLAGMVW
jgi:hypothetical protein